MNDTITIKNSRTTLKDIARLAGVSVSTASIVLTDKAAERRISSEVERRVREVAEQQDYVPNLLVHSLLRGSTNVLSFYNAFGYRKWDDLYMDRLSSAIEWAAGQARFDILTHCDYSRPADEMYRRLNGGRSDGLIFFGPGTENPLLSLLRSSRLPTVMLNHADRENALSSVTDDRNDGMRQIAHELVRLGHRRIAAIRGHWADSLLRIDTLRQYLAEQDIEIPERWIIPVDEQGPESPDQALQTLFNETDPPTALFCWHDRVGYQVLEACERMQITVPDRLSLIGYDGLHWPSRSQHILASIDVHLDGLAAAAIQLMEDILRGSVTSPVSQVFPVTLLRGTTLGPPLCPSGFSESGSAVAVPD